VLTGSDGFDVCMSGVGFLDREKEIKRKINIGFFL
jgi:hypothetical protein